MAQIRTKKDKEKAQQLRLREVAREQKDEPGTSTYSYSSKTAQKSSAATADTLLKVDSRYIVRDLLKTVTISSLLLSVVIGIYFYLRYN